VAAPCAPWRCVRGPVRNGSCGRPFNGTVRNQMSDRNRLYWFEWAGGLGGAAFFGVLGILAISQRHITLGSRFSFRLSPVDGASAILMGLVLLLCAAWCFNLLLRTTRLRRLWRVLALCCALVLAVVAYGGAFDF
jgi:hypothetical protein